MKFVILTLGCKVNQSESDIIEGNLIQRGHSIVPLSEAPDYCIVNTCSVTAKSDYQSRQLIRRALRTGGRVIVSGCYAQLRPAEIERICKDIQVVSNNDKYNIISIIDNTSSEVSLSYSHRSRPLVKIQDGCNNSCSFCIVPYARGRSRSMEPHVIIDQILKMEGKGFREIVLTGIHIGSYGYDLTLKINLSRLVEMILKNTGISRIRISSIAVNEIDNKLIELLCDKRLCNHLHIPLQSGDDIILRRMNRHYDASGYLKKIRIITKKIPDIAIGTDVMTGFPGETDGAFRNTKRVIEEAPFAYIHIFPYSPRSGTPAALMGGEINNTLKKKRCDELGILNTLKKTVFQSSQIDKILDVIIEETDPDHYMTGTSSNYLKIKVPSDNLEKKSLVAVRIAGSDGNTLSGVVEKKL